MQKQQQGAGLIEALIIIVIIAVGVLGILKFHATINYYESLAQKRAIAALLAEQKIETLRAYQVLNNTSGYTSYDNIVSGSSTNGEYTITWTVNSTSVALSYQLQNLATGLTTNLLNGLTANGSLSLGLGASVPVYKIVDVTVTWVDRYNKTQSVKLTSIIAGLDPAKSGYTIKTPPLLTQILTLIPNLLDLIF